MGKTSAKRKSRARVANGGIAFRRFVTLRNGRVLDAHAYGHRAWPIGRR
jgi:hypothetical protein